MRETKGYFPKLTPHNGFVCAEINKKTDPVKDTGHDINVMSKDFGSQFRRSPKESDWNKARDWCRQQMKLISENEDLL
jgi:hypothetical protein